MIVRAVCALGFLLILPFLSLSQNNGEVTWTWTGNYGNGNDPSIANHLVVDDSSNLYIAGVFRGELGIQSDTIYGNPNSDRVFVAKFDSTGDLKWLKKIDWGYYVNHIRLDSDNDLRVLCNSGIMIVYRGLDGLPLTYYNLPDAPSSYHRVVDFCLDSDDNMYALYSNDVDSNLNWNSINKIEVFSTPNDTISGSLWSRTFEVGILGLVGPTGMSIDTNRNVYISGATDGADLSLVGNTVTSVPSGASQQLYTVKYNAQGDAIWLDVNQTAFASVAATEVNTVDNSLYVTGYTVADDVINGDTLFLDTTNISQIFLMKYDLDGNYQWAKPFPLATKTLKSFPGAAWGAMGTHLSVTDSGYVYLKGSFTGSIIFQNDTLIEDTSSVVIGQFADDVFIAKLDMNGNPIWGKYGGNTGGLGYETGDFWVDPATDILFLVGFWASPNNLKTSIPTNSVKGVFIGKEGVPNTLSVNQIEAEDFTLLIYPNPSDGIYYISKPYQTSNMPYQVIDMQGNVILVGDMRTSKEFIDLSDFSSGLYFFKTEFGSTKLFKK